MKKLMLLAVILLGSQVCWGMSEADKALHEAAKARASHGRSMSISDIESALAEGANVNAQDERGNTALLFAVANQSASSDTEMKAVRRLLEAGADVNAGFGAMTPLAIARKLVDASPGLSSEKIARKKALVRLLEEFDLGLDTDEKI